MIKQYQKSKIKDQKSKSFTLIEMIVVISVVGLVIPALFSIIFVILQQQAKIIRLQQVKKEGDSVLAVMQPYIKNNARGIYSDSGLTTEICSKDNPGPYSSLFYFKDRNGSPFRYNLSSTFIILETNSGNVQLTSDKVIIGSFTLECVRSGKFSPPTVSISLTICYKYNSSSTNCTPPTRPEEIASLTYNTRIKLKNYSQ